MDGEETSVDAKVKFYVGTEGGRLAVLADAVIAIDEKENYKIRLLREKFSN